MATTENVTNVYDVSVTNSTVTIAFASYGNGTATSVGGETTLSGDGTTDGGNGTAFKLHDAAASGSTTVDYVGTATDGSGNVVGFIATNGIGTYYLLTNNNYAVGHALNLVISDGPTDSTADNWNLKTGTAVAYCFLAGTGVRTPAGDVPIETLKIGDAVALNNGQTAPVRWLGVQTVATFFVKEQRIFPIRIKANALADSVPYNDLLVSPDHGLLVDDILIQAGALINEISIVRETRLPKVFTYYHVELEDHSLILAENVPAETFVDNVDRLAFDNWREHEELYGNDTSIVEMDYPRAKAYRQVPRLIRDRLLQRAVLIYGNAASAAA